MSKEAREASLQKDDAVLPILLQTRKTFVTSDIPITNQHIQSIPRNHPGIIIIHNANPKQPFGANEAMSIMSNFKGLFQQWINVSWSNSIVDITDEWICVKHIENGSIVFDKHLDFTETGWQQKLADVLLTNSAPNDAIGEDAHESKPTVPTQPLSTHSRTGDPPRHERRPAPPGGSDQAKEEASEGIQEATEG